MFLVENRSQNDKSSSTCSNRVSYCAVNFIRMLFKVSPSCPINIASRDILHLTPLIRGKNKLRYNFVKIHLSRNCIAITKTTVDYDLLWLVLHDVQFTPGISASKVFKRRSGSHFSKTFHKKEGKICHNIAIYTTAHQP